MGWRLAGLAVLYPQMRTYVIQGTLPSKQYTGIKVDRDSGPVLQPQSLIPILFLSAMANGRVSGTVRIDAYPRFVAIAGL